MLRALRVAAVALLVAFAVGGAAPGASHLVAPLWTRQASLAGFALGSVNLAMSDPGAKALAGRDVATGAPRWRLRPPTRRSTPSRPSAGQVAAVVLRNVDSAGATTSTTPPSRCW